MPVREKRQKEPSRDQLLPSHVPSHPQTTAKVPGFSPTPPGCTAEIDSPLEGDGFELPVPRAVVGGAFRYLPANARLAPVS